MSIGDWFKSILGESQPVKPNLEKLFALSTAHVTLTNEIGLEPGGRAGLCFKPLTSARFEGLGSDMQRLLQISAEESGTVISDDNDRYGYRWALLEDEQFEDLIATIHIFSQTLQEEGFGEQLLAAVFKFLRGKQPVYWIYNYKSGNFYPFVPTDSAKRRRDNAYELRLRGLMQRELPLEPEIENWFPLWGVPV